MSDVERKNTDPAKKGATPKQDENWDKEEWVAEGEGKGQRDDSGTYEADQWVGEGQGPGKTPGNTWTKGEWVAEGEGEGQRTDTGTYEADQWVGEGQGKPRKDAPKKPEK